MELLRLSWQAEKSTCSGQNLGRRVLVLTQTPHAHTKRQLPLRLTRYAHVTTPCLPSPRGSRPRRRRARTSRLTTVVALLCTRLNSPPPPAVRGLIHLAGKARPMCPLPRPLLVVAEAVAAQVAVTGERVGCRPVLRPRGPRGRFFKVDSSFSVGFSLKEGVRAAAATLRDGRGLAVAPLPRPSRGALGPRVSRSWRGGGRSPRPAPNPPPPRPCPLATPLPCLAFSCVEPGTTEVERERGLGYY